MSNASPQLQGQPPRRGFTLRAFVLGGLLCVLIGVCGPYGTMVLRGSHLFLDFSTAGAMFLIFMTVLVFNVALRRVWPGADLNRAELTTIAIMCIVASSLPTMGLTAYLLPNITAPYYFHTPENRWAEFIHPTLEQRPWLVPVDWHAEGPQRFEAIRQFYEGLPRGKGESVGGWLTRLPLGPWVQPLVAWAIMLAGLYAVMVSLMVILRKQWVQNERLIYPIAQVPIELIESGVRRDQPPLWRKRVFWIGFAIPFFMGTWTALARYIHGFPWPFRLVTGAQLFGTTYVQFRISFPMIGFAFMIDKEIALSIWVFHLISVAQRVVFAQFGITINQDLACYGAWQKPILAHQGMGAMVVLVGVGLWVARRHLADVFRKALVGDPNVDDSDEILSYRVAVLLFLGGIATMAVWMHLAGLSLPMSILFVLAAILIFTGLTRVVAEGGMAVSIAPLIAPTFVMSGWGSRMLGASGVIALIMTWVWMSDVRTFVMASTAHGLKIAEGVPGRRRPLFWAILLAIVIALVCSIATLLLVSYAYGGINLHGWFYVGGPQIPYKFATTHIDQPVGPHWGGWAWTAVGAAVMAGCMLARRYFLWWPLHPIGYPICAVNWTDYLWASVMIAWLIKSVVLRYGGPSLFRKTRPAFLGLIMGQLSVSGLWYIIDAVTGRVGNVLFSI